MFFMIGLPTETEEDAQQTKKFLNEIKPDWAGISIFTPIPGTEIYNDLINVGLISNNPDFSKFSHQSPNSNFAFNMNNRDEFPELAKETIKFIQAYNGSYKNLFRRALSRNYIKNPKLLIFDFYKFLTWRGLLSKSHNTAHSSFYSK